MRKGCLNLKDKRQHDVEVYVFIEEYISLRIIVVLMGAYRMGIAIKVLIVEDSEDDAVLLFHALQRGGYDPVYEIVDTHEAMSDALSRQSWDLVISDYAMPRFSGLDALKLLQAKDPDTSFVLMTGRVGEEVAVDAMKAGANDYILKSNPARLIPAVERELRDTRARRENRQNEQALRESRERYRLIVETANEGIWQVDDGDRTTFVNQKMAEMLGYTVDEMMGQQPYAFMDEELRGAAEATMQRARQGILGQLSCKFRRKDGTELWTILNGFPIARDNGSHAGIIGLHVDITKRKKAEDALRDREGQLRKITDNMLDMIIQIDKAGIVQYASPSHEALLGYKPEDLLGKSVFDFLHPGDLNRVIAALQERPASGKIEFRLRHADGQYLWMEVIGKFLFDDDGMIAGGIFGGRDITKRKKLEDSLREREELLSQITDNMVDMILKVDAAGAIKYISPSYSNLMGYAIEDRLGKPYFEIIHPDDIKKVASLYKKAITGKIRTAKIEYRVRHADGHYIWLEATGKTLLDDGCRYAGFVVSMRDIAERKQAEGALRESEEKYRMIFNATGTASFIVEADTTINLVNSEFEALSGYSKEETEGKKSWKELFTEDCLDDMIRYHNLRRTDPDNAPKQYETEFITRKGDVKQVIVNVSMIPGTNQSITFILDISGIRQAENELRFSEERFSKAFNASPGPMSISTVPDGRYVDVNEAFLQVLGYRREDVVGFTRSELNILERREDLETAMQNLHQKRSFRNLVASLRTKSGELRTGLISADIIDIHGIEYMLWVFDDITDRKRAEERLEQLSFHDSLTGLYNRSFFEEELLRLDRERLLPLSIILCDINGLKLINDTLGHRKGDELLARAAAILKQNSRSEDIVCRWAGDEFVILLPQADQIVANRICDRIRTACQETEIDSLPLSFSLGAATKEYADQDVEIVFKDADDVMYRNKLQDSRSTRFSVINYLQRALAERSSETFEHIRNIQGIVAIMGNELGLSKKEQEELDILAVLHDIGEIATPAELLAKPCYLTADEWEAIRKHPEIGELIARSVPDLAGVADAILSHHEFWNGAGYPRGLKGTMIPLYARILAIADAYDVMTNGRPYKKSISRAEALDEIRNCAGTQFDPELATLFIATVTS
jgi:diguanylate cyclase (GGDEF)-like protein/PAS domain S-box-containing protein